jgi:hypothetical protein
MKGEIKACIKIRIISDKTYKLGFETFSCLCLAPALKWIVKLKMKEMIFTRENY